MAMRNAIRVAAATSRKKGDGPCCAPQSTLQRQGGGLIWAGELLVVPGKNSSLGYLFRWDNAVSSYPGMGLVSLTALCSGPASATVAMLAIAMGLSFSWMRRNALRCLKLQLLGRNEFRPSAWLVVRRCWTSADDYRRCRQYNNEICSLFLAQ